MQIEIDSMAVLNGFDPPPVRKIEAKMSPSMMCLLLGGSFPDTGFSWDCVRHFKREKDGIWEPYNAFGEILPAIGFKITVEPSAIAGNNYEY